MKKDIENRADIEAFVNLFYSKVRTNSLLSPVFAAKIADNQWPPHLQRMYDFWNAILFAQPGFEGNPMQKHFALPIGERHFEEWLYHFKETIDELHEGPKAEEAKTRAAAIANIMKFKVSTFQKG